MKYVDMHCDTITVLYQNNGDLLRNELHNDLNKMKKGECLLQNFAVFTDIAEKDSSFTEASIRYYYEQLEKYPELIRPVYRYDDIEKNEKDGCISALLTLEEGSVIDNDLHKLDHFYDEGVRMITLTWNYPNGIGFPNFSMQDGDYEDLLYHINEKDGLTPFGIEYVRRMEELGIIVDVSHLSDRGFYDVLKYTTKPFVASHSCARALCGVARNLTKETLEAVADCGFIRRGENLLIIAKTGCGKTFLACAIGHQACRLGMKVLYLGMNHFVHQLKSAITQGITEEFLEKLNKNDLIILDDFALHPIDENTRLALLTLLDDRYEKKSVIITSQLPYDKWYEYIGQTTVADAILDRIQHSSHLIRLEGQSMRENRKKL